MHFLLTYELAPDYFERREACRNEHLAYVWAASDRGELLLGGPLMEPADRALLLFQGESPAPVEAFAAGDPYVVHGVVTGWTVRRWNTVTGPMADAPLRSV